MPPFHVKRRCLILRAPTRRGAGDSLTALHREVRDRRGRSPRKPALVRRASTHTRGSRQTTHWERVAEPVHVRHQRCLPADLDAATPVERKSHTTSGRRLAKHPSRCPRCIVRATQLRSAIRRLRRRSPASSLRGSDYRLPRHRSEVQSHPRAGLPQPTQSLRRAASNQAMSPDIKIPSEASSRLSGEGTAPSCRKRHRLAWELHPSPPD